MKSSLIFLFILLLSVSLFPQEDTFSPFPSRLKIYQNNLDVILTWKDSPDLEGEDYAIYRSRSAITEEFIAENDPIAIMPRNMGIYTDHPDGSGAYYYGIICVTDEKVYPICLPFRNCTDSPILVGEQQYQSSQAVQVQNLKAEVLDDKVALSFTSLRKDRPVAVFRSLKPLTIGGILEDSTLIRILEEGQQYYLDTPIAGITYYYAVIDYPLFLSGERALLYSGNYTESGIERPLTHFLGSAYIETESRRAPLPDIRLERFFSEIKEANLQLPPEQTLDQDIETDISRFTVQSEVVPLLLPEALAYEQVESSLRIEQSLQEIVRRDILSESNWKEASNLLLSLLYDLEDDSLRARIHYYRGQCHYFSGFFEEAYLDFSLAAKNYPQESRKWMEDILYRL